MALRRPKSKRGLAPNPVYMPLEDGFVHDEILGGCASSSFFNRYFRRESTFRYFRRECRRRDAELRVFSLILLSPYWLKFEHRQEQREGKNHDSKKSRMSMELETIMEDLCEALDAEDVMKILELEDPEAMKEVDLSDLVTAVAEWPKEDDTLWSTVTSERLRTVLAAIMAANDSGACVAYCDLASVAGAPASVASPAVLRCVARFLEQEPQKKKRRSSTDSDDDDSDDEAPRKRRRRKPSDSTKKLFTAWCRCVTSEEWPRLQSELQRTDHGSLVTRFAAIAAKRMTDDDTATDALAALMPSEGDATHALEALFDPVLTTTGQAFFRRLKRALANVGPDDGLQAFRQRLCLRAAGTNAASRSRLATAIVSLGPEDDEFSNFVAEKLAKAGQAKYRSFAVDLLANLELSEAVEGRILDKSPAVRARALAAMEKLQGTNHAVVVDRALHDDKANVRARALKCLEHSDDDLSTELRSQAVAAAAAASKEDHASVRFAGVGLLAAWFHHSEVQPIWPTAVLARATDKSPAVAHRVADAVDQWLSRLLKNDEGAWTVADIVALNDRHRKAFRFALRGVSTKKVVLTKAVIQESLKKFTSHTKKPALVLLEDILTAFLITDESGITPCDDPAVVDRLRREQSQSNADDASRAAALRIAKMVGLPIEEDIDILGVGPETAVALAQCRGEDDDWCRRMLRRASDACRSTSDAEALSGIRAIGAVLATTNSEASSVVEVLVSACDDHSRPPEHRREAIAALGRAASASPELAKDHIRRFAREIHVSHDPAIRTTCCCVLAELCGTHAAYAEPRISALARAATIDRDPIVRRHAVVLLGRLVARDYIKFRPDLAHRVFGALADPDLVVGKLAKTALIDVLLPKHPTLVVNNLVAAVFVFNGARCAVDDPKLRRAAFTAGFASSNDDLDDEEIHQLRSFETDLNDRFADAQSKRRKVYSALLEATPDEGKIQIAAKLSKDVLANAADDLLGDLGKDGPASSILSDALHLLTSDLTVSAKKTTEKDDDDLDDEDPAVPAALVAAKGRLLSKMSKKHLLEQILPILINLKATLEKHKSPLLQAVMTTLKTIVTRYGADVDVVLQEDPHLAAELKYDLEREPKQPRRRRKSGTAAPQQESPQA